MKRLGLVGARQILFLSLFIPLGLVVSQPSSGLSVTKTVLAGGGGMSSGGVFQVISTTGQPAVGSTLSGGSFASTQGFWSIPAETFDSWRAEFFTPAELNDPDISGATADPAMDGVPNLLKFAFSLPPKQPAGESMFPQFHISGPNFVISFTEPPGVVGLSYSAAWTASLVNNNWTPISDFGIPPEHIFMVPIGGNPEMFGRVFVNLR